VQNSFMLENVVGGSLTELGLLAEPITVENGIGRPSQTPGHGMVFDWSAIARHTLTSDTVRNRFSGGSK
jgi:hypothetical protein